MNTHNKKIKIIPLGGLDEIGKNITLIETEKDLVVIDCGMGFPEDDQLGIDTVLPNYKYLLDNREKLRGLLLTHGHEDHIGATPYFRNDFPDCPIFGSRFTIGLIIKKFEEFGANTNNLISVDSGDVVELGAIKAEFITVTHSIPGAFAISLSAFGKTIFCTGDFKLDMSSLGERTDMKRLASVASKGVDVLLCESTNVDRPGYTKSEDTVFPALEASIRAALGRVIVVSFASNVYRLQQVFEIAANAKRKVAISGRSMENAIDVAITLGYIKIKKNVLISIEDISRFHDDKIIVLMTGSQGERFSALSRLAHNNHKAMTIKETDTIIFSSSQVPGNEKSISQLIDELSRKCTSVINGSTTNVHVSGHACQEELKILQSLLSPTFFIPIHGEYWRQKCNAQLAKSVGIREKNIIIPKNGDVIEIGNNQMNIIGEVPHGSVFVDGSGIGDIGRVVLRERGLLSQNGYVIALLCINKNNQVIHNEILTRGFVFEREAQSLLSKLKDISNAQISAHASSSKNQIQIEAIKTELKKKLADYIFETTKRRPIVDVHISLVN